jgi:hypothetical protein
MRPTVQALLRGFVVSFIAAALLLPWVLDAGWVAWVPLALSVIIEMFVRQEKIVLRMLLAGLARIAGTGVPVIAFGIFLLGAIS